MGEEGEARCEDAPREAVRCLRTGRVRLVRVGEVITGVSSLYAQHSLDASVHCADGRKRDRKKHGGDGPVELRLTSPRKHIHRGREDEGANHGPVQPRLGPGLASWRALARARVQNLLVVRACET